MPTLNEADNVRELLTRVLRACGQAGISAEVIVVDDGSTDGTTEIVEDMAKEGSIKLVRRTGKIGITSAVLEGFQRSCSPIIGAMDSDLSHPPEMIPDMVQPIVSGRADMVVASRYSEGGSVSGWPLFRLAVSKTASTLARPLTKVRDPMSGFFLLRRAVIEDSALSTRGWKICLEILVKARPERVAEVPYTFVDRARGSSKMKARTIADFLLNLIDLYAFRFLGSSMGSFLRFCTVGGSGVFLNLAIVYVLVEHAGVWYMASATASFFIVAVNNFLWNKIWTFRDRRTQARVVGVQLGRFLVSSLIALGINLVVLIVLVEVLGLWYLLAQLLAIGVAVMANFSLSSRWVFGDRPSN